MSYNHKFNQYMERSVGEIVLNKRSRYTISNKQEYESGISGIILYAWCRIRIIWKWRFTMKSIFLNFFTSVEYERKRKNQFIFHVTCIGKSWFNNECLMIALTNNNSLEERKNEQKCIQTGIHNKKYCFECFYKVWLDFNVASAAQYGACSE